MSRFDSFFLMKPRDVMEYVVEVLHYFQAEEGLQCEEIGDGNINYVTRVWREADGKSVIVKQADKLLRSSGRPLDIHRSQIEGKILQLQGELAPGFVPEVYHYDETLAALVMEDISDYKNLRKELMANHIYDHLGDTISTFLAEVLLPTTDLVMDPQEKKKQVGFFLNPELCDITEDLVLTEPYYEPYFRERNKNIITPGNENFVHEKLFLDEELKAEVAQLRDDFMNHAQALLHGDLHTGSIFVSEKGIKIIDPEFAFYGPMGYDIGNVIGNFYFSLAGKWYSEGENAPWIEKIEGIIQALFDQTKYKLEEKYREIVTFPFYQIQSYREKYIRRIMGDSLGYAGTEMIRRTVGDSKVAEVTSVKDLEVRIPMERTLIQMGIWLIKNRENVRYGRELIDAFRGIVR